MQPAYIAVAARRTLTKEPPAVSTPTQTQTQQQTQFSPAVVDYVHRAFFEFNRHKDSPLFATITESDLRKKLSEIVHDGTKDSLAGARDWSTYPLPHEFLLKERQDAAMYVAQDAILANINQPYPNALQYSATSVPLPVVGSKKRKSLDQEQFDENSQYESQPAKKKNTKGIADRITGKSKNQEKKAKDASGMVGLDMSQEAINRRRERFGNISSDSTPVHAPDNSPVKGPKDGPIVGTCQTLEKNYFRLTAPPNPNTVRPLPVLEQALNLVLEKWKTQHDYTYTCDQLKSIRQDLTVQRIKTPFTIKVYERHAVIALEKKDMGEYNQCQTQLRGLYKSKLGPNGTSGGKHDEFTAYHVLYLIYTRSRTDMNNMLADLTTAEKKGKYVQIALQVRAALAAGNYHRFFKLYDSNQDKKMIPYLMDMFIERERIQAMAVICRTFKQSVDTKFLAGELAFQHEEAVLFEGDVHRTCCEWICRHGGEHLLEPKDGGIRFNSAKAGRLFEDAKTASRTVDIKGQI